MGPTIYIELSNHPLSHHIILMPLLLYISIAWKFQKGILVCFYDLMADVVDSPRFKFCWLYIQEFWGRQRVTSFFWYVTSGYVRFILSYFLFVLIYSCLCWMLCYLLFCSMVQFQNLVYKLDDAYFILSFYSIGDVVWVDACTQIFPCIRSVHTVIT